MDVNIGDVQIDALREIATIGAGNAATALSQLIRKRVNINVPRVSLMPIEKAPSVFGDSESLITAIYLQMLGDVSGVILLSFKKDDALRLADILMGNNHGTAKILNDMSRSALEETASILAGSYINALSKVLNIQLLISSPAFAQDMAGALVDAVLAETCMKADSAIIVDTELDVVGEKVMTYFFFAPEEESLGKILKLVGVGG